MTKLSLLFLASASLAAPSAVLAACATDNGDAVHGPQFGPVPERPDGSSTADGDVPGSEAGPGDSEGGADGGTDGDLIDSAMPACTLGTVAVLAGNDNALTGAVRIGGGAWTALPIGGGAAKSAPSLVAFGSGFSALTRGPGDALQSVTYGASWSAAASIGALTTLGTPALTALGTKLETVYLSGPTSGGADANKFFRLENAGGGAVWSTTPDPVMPSGGAQSFGPSAGAVGAGGTDLVFAQDGSDEGLYVQTWSGGTWKVPAPILGAGTFPSSSPALVAVSGKFDLVLLYPDNTANHVIGFATRDATSKAWSSGAVTQPTAQTGAPMSVALVSPTSLVVSFLGNNQRPYVMFGTLGATSITWNAPVPLLADTSTVDSAPAVAKGICGDDAIAVYASGGQIKATQHHGTTWSVPATITGASGSRVSVATR